MNKNKWLAIAEIVDSLRIFPRAFLIACFVWTCVVTQQLLTWYMAMSKEDRGVEAAGFASVVFLTIFGFLKMVYDTYSKAGRTWGAPAPTTSTSTVVATTTETSP